MATASCLLSEDQLQCCICLEVFTDPVATSCGHNFCKNCIDRHWADTVVYKCPYCKQVFNSRPELKVNILISEMAEHFRNKASRNSAQQAAKPGEIPCDVCPEPKLKALKSCLVCLASYCESHLEPHLSVPGLKRHQLIDPKSNLSERVCVEHDKPLELYCKNDQVCVCVLCTYWGHKSHEVVPLKYAFEQQKQQLGETEADIQKMIKMKELKIKELHHSVQLSNTEADREITDGVKVFTALKESVERGLDKLIQEVTRRRTATEEKARGFIKELEQEISALKRRSSEVEQLSNSEDHLQFLQHFSQLSSAPVTKDWADVHICPPTYRGTVVRALSELEQDFNKQTRNLFKGELERVKTFKENIQLDRDTAHPQLTVSNDGKEVSYSKEKITVPYSPKRFDGLYVLGTQGFSKTFYFEVEVKGESEWTVGVAKESVNRKGTITLNPQNGFWTIGFKYYKYNYKYKYKCKYDYCAFADPEVCLLTKCKPETIGVFVDYEEGVVSFYDVGARDLIYSFSGFSFKGKLFPLCSPAQHSFSKAASLVMNWIYEDVLELTITGLGSSHTQPLTGISGRK